MALTASGLYVANFVKAFTNGFSVTLNMTSANYRLGLINDSANPNFTLDTVYATGSGTYGPNEATGAGWNSGNAGGHILSAAFNGASVVPTFTGASGSVKYDHTNDISVTGTTLANVHGAFLHTSTAATPNNSLICLIWFGGQPYSTSNGTFGISWASGGVFTIDLTP